MKKVVAEPVRDLDFSQARRGAVIPVSAGKTKLSIRLDTAIVDWFRKQVELAGNGNYQTLINDALGAYVQQQSMLEAVRQVVREELAAGALRQPPGSSRAAGRSSPPAPPSAGSGG